MKTNEFKVGDIVKLIPNDEIIVSNDFKAKVHRCGYDRINIIILEGNFAYKTRDVEGNKRRIKGYKSGAMNVEDFKLYKSEIIDDYSIF